MYYDFYQLKENPFNVTADPELFFASKSHSDAISNLIYGIEQRKGLLVLTGEVGTGKTTLCRKLLKQAPKNIKFALVLNPNFSEVELLQIILHDLGIRTREQNKFGLINTLNTFLLKEAKKGRNVVLVIDESQNLSINQLEQVRLLLNLETEKEKLLQIILVGQPELHDAIQLPELRQLRQRVAVHFQIDALEKSDIKSYIHHRIKKSMRRPDAARQIVFTDAAIDYIYRYSKGSPRSINVLCDRALLAGYVAETYAIDEYIINDCAKEVLYCEHHL